MLGFKKDLEKAINTHNIDNDMNVADYILAQTICDFIESIHWMNQQNKKHQ